MGLCTFLVASRFTFCSNAKLVRKAQCIATEQWVELSLVPLPLVFYVSQAHVWNPVQKRNSNQTTKHQQGKRKRSLSFSRVRFFPFSRFQRTQPQSFSATGRSTLHVLHNSPFLVHAVEEFQLFVFTSFRQSIGQLCLSMNPSYVDSVPQLGFLQRQQLQVSSLLRTFDAQSFCFHLVIDIPGVSHQGPHDLVDRVVYVLHVYWVSQHLSKLESPIVERVLSIYSSKRLSSAGTPASPLYFLRVPWQQRHRHALAMAHALGSCSQDNSLGAWAIWPVLWASINPNIQSKFRHWYGMYLQPVVFKAFYLVHQPVGTQNCVYGALVDLWQQQSYLSSKVWGNLLRMPWHTPKQGSQLGLFPVISWWVSVLFPVGPKVYIFQVLNVFFLRKAKREILMLFQQNSTLHKTCMFPVTPLVLLFDGSQNCCPASTFFISAEKKVIDMARNDPF